MTPPSTALGPDSEEPIYGLACECDNLLNHLQDERPETHPEALPIAELCSEFQQRFAIWAAHLGVFARKSQCLDTRLRNLPDLQDLVVRLLDILRRSLQQCDVQETATGEQSDSLKIALQAIDDALTRLNRLGVTIRRSSFGKVEARAKKFAAGLDLEPFADLCTKAVHALYPGAHPSLREYLAKTMTDRYVRISFLGNRNSTLKTRREPSMATMPPIPEIPTDDTEPNILIPQTETATDGPIMTSRAVNLTVASQSDLTSVNTQMIRSRSKAPDEASTSFPKTASIQVNQDNYPMPPVGSEDGNIFTCKWCSEQLNKKTLSKGEWRRHIDRDLKPYVCLSETCDEGHLVSETFGDWATHMGVHSRRWHQQAYLTSSWICTVCEQSPATYNSPQALYSHLEQRHGGDFTNDQLQAISRQSKTQQPRAWNDCLLCCFTVADQDTEAELAMPKRQRRLSGRETARHASARKTLEMRAPEPHGSETDSSSSCSDSETMVSHRDRSKAAARHISAHLQVLMLLTLRFASLQSSDGVSDKDIKSNYVDVDDGNSASQNNDLGRLSDVSFEADITIEDEGEQDMMDETMDSPADVVTDDVEVPDTEFDLQHIPRQYDGLAPDDDPILKSFESIARQPQAPVFFLYPSEEDTSISRKPCFCVPFHRDPDFVDRPDIMTWLKEQYTGSAGRMALVGMGGFGYRPPHEHSSRTAFALTNQSKSQIAIEFAYHIYDDSPQTSVFWVHASSKPRFEEAYRSIAQRLELPRRNDPDIDVLGLVRDWLQTEEAGSWLMVLDNVDDVDLIHPRINASAANQTTDENAVAKSDQRPLAAYLPKCRSGTILVTSRSMDAAEKLTGSHKAVYRISAMDDAQGLQLFRNKLIGDFDKDAAADLLRALDCIPLAITQAAAYINRRAPRASVKTYLDAFRESDKKKGNLLNRDAGDLRRDETVSNSVVTTWQVTFEQIRRERPSAAKLLSFMSFFNPQGIPEFVLHDYSTDPTDNVDRDAESDDFEDDFDVLRGYSLVSMTVAQDICEVHSLVQFCTRAWISMVDDIERWRQVFLRSMSRHFPSGAFETWPTCQLLLPHIESILEEKPPDEDLQNWARLLTSCAWYMLTIGKYTAAEKLGGKAVKARTKVLGDEYPDTLTSMANLASIFSNQGRWKEAEELQVGVMETSKRVLGEEHPSTLSSIRNLASTYRNQGRWEEAENLDVEVMERTKAKLGADHPDTLTSMGNLASTYRNQGRWEEAENLDVEVMERTKAKLGADHPDTLTSMGNLASAYRNQGRWEEAENLDVEVMERTKAKLGADHPDTLTSMANLAFTWHSQGRQEDALVLMQDCVHLRQKKLGHTHPDTQSSVATLQSWQASRLAVEDASNS